MGNWESYTMSVNTPFCFKTLVVFVAYAARSTFQEP